MTVKLPWPGFTEKRTVIIPLGIDSFPLSKKPITISDGIFEPKNELHITLIGKKSGSIVFSRIKQNHEVELQLKEKFESIDWSYKRKGPALVLSRIKQHVGKKGEISLLPQKSIILLLEMKGILEFYDYLRSQGLTTGNISTPPPHVTMYTQNCPDGIGIKNKKLLKKLTKRKLKRREIIVFNGCKHHS